MSAAARSAARQARAVVTRTVGTAIESLSSTRSESVRAELLGAADGLRVKGPTTAARQRLVGVLTSAEPFPDSAMGPVYDALVEFG